MSAHPSPPSVVEGAASDLRLHLGPFALAFAVVGVGITVLAAVLLPGGVP